MFKQPNIKYLYCLKKDKNVQKKIFFKAWS